MKKEQSAGVRVDTYLWAIRMFKSRSLASESIKGGKVKLNDAIVKASHLVKVGEVYTITISSTVKKIVEVKHILDKRPSFDIAKNYYIDHSPPMEKTDREERAFYNTTITHEKGSGRPTKKDRRDLKKKGGWF